jgi:glutamine amidotransferase
MCRFTLYIGSKTPLSALLTEPNHSLIKQSFDSKERIEPLNGDGFGIGWYINNDPNPARFRAASPAWNNSNLYDLSRATHSNCILAHIRAATQGFAVTENNCHPFKFDNLLMAHNGNINQFYKIKRNLLNKLNDDLFTQINGNTDSEHFFALYTENLRANLKVNTNSLHAMTIALHNTIADVVDLVNIHTTDNADNTIFLNCAITNGLEAVICRFTTNTQKGPDSLYICREHDNSHCVIVSSEPLCQDRNWLEVPKYHILTIDKDLNINTQAITV